MKKTNNELLKERIEQNYADFKTETLELDEESIYDMAGRVAAVKDAYEQLATYEYLDEDEAGYLLKFYNPLEMTADFLEAVRGGQLVEVDDALFEVFEQEDNEENYITIEFAEELRQEYGDDISIKNALLLETVKASKEFLRLWKLMNEGVDFCHSEE